MSDNDEDEEVKIELGPETPVEGAPIARIASRFHYAIEKSEIIRREGDTTIRTPDGPRTLEDILAESEDVYFGTRQAFINAVEDVIGTGPIPIIDE